MAVTSSIRQAKRLKLPLVLPGSEGKPKSTMRTIATDIKKPTIPASDPTINLEQLERQTGNNQASRKWTGTSEPLDED
ncbi:hypothetical protein RvY_00910 [Ramazzottius varieornatus]|uniref:Uncharacterized protein n=1 Tax=Ramazzottius varieornatus TaxID=947166 RepID=A0A1D1UEF5_RAMVA|nr:hypothetical protein RvY_00910 [Ramazzottius varieornatus]